MTKKIPKKVPKKRASRYSFPWEPRPQGIMDDLKKVAAEIEESTGLFTSVSRVMTIAIHEYLERYNASKKK